MIKEVRYTKDFGEKLEQKRDMTGFPRNVLFELTHCCNLHCRHCYVVPKLDKRELATSEVRSIFDQLVEAGCLHLTLTGGEPLVREDIFSLIDYARRIGLFIHLFTNAFLITPEIADKLKEFQLISLEISFHSLKKERFDWFTQTEGSFDKVMTAINLLKQRNVKLALKINITKLNFDEIEDLKAFVKKLEIVPEWATLLMPRSNGSRDNLSLRLEPEQVLEAGNRLYLKPAEGTSTEEPKKNWIKDRLFQCGAGKKSLAINPYGELKPCLDFSSCGYSILEGSLREGWKRLGNFIDLFKTSSEYKCLDCNLRDYCLSCPAKAKLECGDINCCPDYYRKLAEISFRNDKDKKPGV